MALTKASFSMIDGSVANVRDFGAVGDNATDDYSAIAAAIATGKAVYFPPGDYRVSQTIILSNIGQRVFGASIGDTGGNGTFIGATADFTGNATIEVTGGRNQVLENLFIRGNGANGAAGVQIDALRLTNAPSFAMNNIICKFGIAGVRHIRGNIQKWWNIFCEANDFGFVIEPDTVGGDCNGSTILGCRAYASYEWGWDIKQGTATNGVMHSNFDIAAEGGNNGIRIRQGMYNQFKLYSESNTGQDFDTVTSQGNFVYIQNPDNAPSSDVQLLESSYNVGIYSSGTNVYFDGGYAPERVIEREFSSVGGSLLNVGVRAYDLTNTSGGTRPLTLGWLSYSPVGMRVLISKRDNTAGFSLSAPGGISLVGDTGTFGAFVSGVKFLEVFKLNGSTAICKQY